MRSMIAMIILCLFTGFHHVICLEVEKEDDRCETTMKRIYTNDRATVTDNTPSRLHTTWVSQECEVRAGPVYVTRKYSFFKNGTFLLLQYYYAEESCSIATYTVVARGLINILSQSMTIPGAVETNVQLDSVHLIPLNRQVAHKFSRRMNTSCGGVETKWRPYTVHLIYERPILNTNLYVHELNSNSLQSRLSRPRERHTLDCLKSFNIEFIELELLRVEVKRFHVTTNLSIHNAVDENKAIDCPICGTVYRATEYSPPLFHEAPSLPAMIGGFWLSIRCESVDEGFWSRRFFRIYPDDSRWFAHWTYYADSTCSNILYTVNAAGTYVQRAVRRTRDAKRLNIRAFDSDRRLDRVQELNVYRQMLQDAEESIMLRENRREMEIARETISSLIQKDTPLPSGTTELELRVLKSFLIPVGKRASINCKATKGIREIRRIRRNEADLRSKNCIPGIVESPTTLKLKAKIGLDWKGDYTLLLASWKDDVWEAPLRRCSGTTLRNYLQKPWQEYLPLSGRDNRYNRFNRYRRHWFSSSLTTCLSTSFSLLHSIILLLLYSSYFVY